MTAKPRGKKRPARRRSAEYSSGKAGAFWTKRLASTNPLAAVLTYSAPSAVNTAYDYWERSAVAGIVGQSLRGKTAVDLGAGTGRISLLLAAKGARVAAVDVSAGMLGQLMRTARARRLHRAITPILASATNVPSAEKSADIITCCGLLEHLPGSARARALDEAFRLMKSAGKMIVVVNNSESIFLTGGYGMTKQRADGYFVGLVGLPWLMARVRRAGMIARVRAANPWYACAHYLSCCKDGPKVVRPMRAAELRRWADFDLQTDPGSPMVARLASHYVVEVTRR